MIRKKIDCHMHTSFSPDGMDSPEAFVKRAIEYGLEYIAITDHMDVMYSHREYEGLLHFEEYFRDINLLKEKYPQIYIARGIEAGYSEAGYLGTKKAIENNSFEYVINSVHEVNGDDCYYASHFEGKPRDLVYNNYYDAVLRSLDASYNYHSIGHLSYVSRTAPYKDKVIKYTDFSDKIDEVLRKVIANGKIIELNTNVYGCGTPSLPDFDIVARYRELGGELLTFSSDAHRIARMCDNYEFIAQKAIDCGFSHFATVRDNKIVMVKIED